MSLQQPLLGGEIDRIVTILCGTVWNWHRSDIVLGGHGKVQSRKRNRDLALLTATARCMFGQVHKAEPFLLLLTKYERNLHFRGKLNMTTSSGAQKLSSNLRCLRPYLDSCKKVLAAIC